jgi:hypothetical protein
MVRQMSLFSEKLPYKYIIDSSSIFSQKTTNPIGEQFIVGYGNV